MVVVPKRWRQKLQRADRQRLMVGFNVAIAILILGRTVLDAKVGQPRAVTFPSTVTLADWNLIDSQSLDVFTMSTGEPDYAPVGQRYTFVPEQSVFSERNGNSNGDGNSNNHSNGNTQNSHLTLTVELRYMLDTQGFIQRLLLSHPEFQAALATVDAAQADPIVRHKQGIGYYGVFQIQEQTYLSACVNPRGESTFTIDQFLQNQQIYDGDPSRFFAVILGREVWRDNRCLWTHMAIAPNPELSPTPQTLTEQAAKLEAAWVEWHQMWQPQFPAR